jgi:hypothetical protein
MLTLPLEGEGTFLDFSDLLTGYRLSEALMRAHEAGVFEAVGQEGREGPALCARVGWEPVYGDRFLRCLCGLGLLRRQGSRYFLSRFAATYLCSASEQYQGNTLAFEQKLQQSWQRLPATLASGKRAAPRDKNPQELQLAFATYLGAMDEAARIRAAELWEKIPITATSGAILDIGAGAGTFLLDFLSRYPGWRAIFCDLPEVVADAELHHQLAGMASRLNWCACNLLDDGPSGFDAIINQSCDLVLLSNIIHCQGTAETKMVLRKAAAKTAEHGLLVIHDFFSDTGWRGALYDLHMMLHTYNGKIYSLQEVIEMVAPFGFCHSLSKQLPSGSTALVLAQRSSTQYRSKNEIRH